MDESPLFIKTYDLIRWTLTHTQKYPKNERYRIAKRMEDSLLDSYECIIDAARMKNPVFLDQADAYLDKYRLYLRLSKDFGNTNTRQYAFASEKIFEIGRMIGSWKKSCKKQLTDKAVT